MHNALVDFYITRCCAVLCCAWEISFCVLVFSFFKKVRKTMRIFSFFLVTDSNIQTCTAVRSIKF